MAYELEVISRGGGGASRYPPLLFVHGLGHAAWCWAEHFLDFFAERGFDASALSLRGHGASGGRDRLRWASIADYVNDVEQVAAGLPRKPVVIGHSMGGLIVQRYLERHDPSAAVLLAPVPPGGMFLQTARLFLANPRLMLNVFLTTDPGKLFSPPERARKLLFSRDLGEKAARRYAAQLGRESFRAGLDVTYLRPDPARVRGTPMLVLGAERDRLIPTRDVMRTAEAYGAELRILPNLAHDVMLDTGWRQAADVLLEWLVRTLEGRRV
ncbi:MAG: lysophospholipase [Acidobacteria bacterium]|nr:lysophospholipase [Acidobacteriota bacterium]MYJ03985.1 lysophospholipase [Acidobacteriota bacterium]